MRITFMKTGIAMSKNMPDRETVIGKLHDIMDHGPGCTDERIACPILEAISLLKQRCEDCAYYREGQNELDSWMWCKLLGKAVEPDFFCGMFMKKGQELHDKAIIRAGIGKSGS